MEGQRLDWYARRIDCWELKVYGELGQRRRDIVEYNIVKSFIHGKLKGKEGRRQVGEESKAKKLPKAIALAVGATMAPCRHFEVEVAQRRHDGVQMDDREVV